MGFSVKLKIDTARPKKDGSRAIFFQVIINREKHHIGLELAWPLSKFSLNEGCKPRSKNDEDVDDYNIIINNVRSKANSIYKEYRLRDRRLTMESFKKDYYSNLNKNSFIDYFEKKSRERWSKQKIADLTYKSEKRVLVVLKEYSPNLCFNDFEMKWAEDFDYILKTKMKLNIRRRKPCFGVKISGLINQCLLIQKS